MSDEPRSRLSAEDRREQILAAASAVFGERGYAGGTTDAIAKQAGVSQAYVVRMFGSKEKLFRAAVERASERVQTAFRDVIATFTGDESDHDKRYQLGVAYANLVEDRGILMTLLQAFCLGHDEVIGPIARECFLDAYRIARDEAGMPEQEAAEFFSQGMLMTILFALRMPQETDDAYARDLMSCAFGAKANDLISLAHLQLPLTDASRV